MATNRVYELQYHAYCAIGSPWRAAREKTFHEKSNASRTTVEDRERDRERVFTLYYHLRWILIVWNRIGTGRGSESAINLKIFILWIDHFEFQFYIYGRFISVSLIDNKWNYIIIFLLSYLLMIYFNVKNWNQHNSVVKSGNTFF